MLEVRLLGQTQVMDGPVRRDLRPNELNLLAYLLLQRGRPVPREQVAAALWSDGTEPLCRRRLSTTLWRLRKQIGRPASSCVHTDRHGRLGVDLSQVSLDVTTFEAAVEQIGLRPVDQVGPDDVGRLRAALDHYRGDLLEGHDSHWALQERERLQRLYLAASTRLMEWHQARGQLQAALEMGYAILDRDPLREAIHREVIRCHGHLGARAEAVDHYRQLHQRLRDELGLDPMPETTALVEQIQAATHAPAGHPATRSRYQLLPSLRVMRTQLEALTRQVDAAIAQLLDG